MVPPYRLTAYYRPALLSFPMPSAETDHQPFRLWSALEEAVRGSQQDYTTGPIGRAALLLAVPMVLETALESVFAVGDVFFVSRLGAEVAPELG